MARRAGVLNELREKILKKKDLSNYPKSIFSGKQKRLCISSGATHYRWGLIKQIHGIDSDCNTKAVGLNRFYAVDNKANIRKAGIKHERIKNFQ